ncbi:uncharacterized protein EAF01_011080 [Botrytis porri]|uniref:Uncharacterized protein n=1 Tax=Botrytis porri TaxID=87229 RepID=A0A4Z1KN88_9HELO|nr:uncharacterized protein EAF01_011080 [Botrytis porri]KAF7887926.1 hypothetical protein EAF01_011080 [Botrytis porri]TGO82849.1 hypothetical protein BPOR_0745g00020 [Botrytis porri]
MAANNTETITTKSSRPKKIILDISASFSLSDISTSKVEESEGLKFGFNSTSAIRRVSKKKASPSTKSNIGTSAFAAAIASAPTTTEESKGIAIPATSTAIVPIPATIDKESDWKSEAVIDSLDPNMPGIPSAENRSSLVANATTMIASPILAQVQRMQSVRSASTQETPASSSSQSPKPKPSQSQPKPARTATKSTKSELPLKALNQSITSRLTTPAGARSMGRGKGEKPLPGNYQSVARRVTMTIVALPILFVTSWVLWDRLVLGQEKKSLLREPPMVPGPPMAAEMEARNNRE